jgi:hypothetical protein
MGLKSSLSSRVFLRRQDNDIGLRPMKPMRSVVVKFDAAADSEKGDAH